MFSFLSSKILNFILGGSTIALVLALSYVTITKNTTIHNLSTSVTSLTKERDAARDDLRTSRANERELEISIRDQNSEIDRMRREGQSREKLINSLREDPKAKGRVIEILSRKGETCEDADKLIAEVIR